VHGVLQRCGLLLPMFRGLCLCVCLSVSIGHNQKLKQLDQLYYGVFDLPNPNLDSGWIQ